LPKQNLPSVILGRLNRDNANQDILRGKLGFTALGAHLKNPKDYDQGKHHNGNRYILSGVAAFVLIYQGASYTANIQLDVNADRALQKLLSPNSCSITSDGRLFASARIFLRKEGRITRFSEHEQNICNSDCRLISQIC